MLSNKALRRLFSSSVSPQFNMMANTKAQVNASELRTPIMNPQWWMGTLPIQAEDYIIDFKDYNIDPRDETLPKEIIDLMKMNYAKTGLVLLTNTGTKDLTVMKKWAENILNDGASYYRGGANSREQIGAAVYDTGAPSCAHLHYHHEQAYVMNSVKNLAFLCDQATENKGWMWVSNNDVATRELMKLELGHKLKE